MVQYPDCPFCGNASLSIVDVEINGISLKGIQCNNPECCKIFGVYKDYAQEIKELREKLEEIEGEIDV